VPPSTAIRIMSSPYTVMVCSHGVRRAAALALTLMWTVEMLLSALDAFRPNHFIRGPMCRVSADGMTKYHVDRIITGAGPLVKWHCAALHHATNYRQLAGDAGVRAVGRYNINNYQLPTHGQAEPVSSTQVRQTVYKLTVPLPLFSF